MEDDDVSLVEWAAKVSFFFLLHLHNSYLLSILLQRAENLSEISSPAHKSRNSIFVVTYFRVSRHSSFTSIGSISSQKEQFLSFDLSGKTLKRGFAIIPTIDCVTFANGGCSAPHFASHTSVSHTLPLSIRRKSPHSSSITPPPPPPSDSRHSPLSRFRIHRFCRMLPWD
jgi:hypothetical protein